MNKQRQIKFRAWDKKNREMIMSGDRPSFSFWKWVDYDSTTPLMEYTGLKDKNRKEIYEGDVVATIQETDAEPIVTQEEVTFDGAAFYPVCNQPGETWEVIGNIYENPELLNNND